MSRSDRYASLFFLVLAAFICQQSMGIGVGTLSRPGPGLLSFGAGAAMGLLALAFLIGTFMKGKADSDSSRKAEGESHRATVVAVSLSLFAFTIAVNWLGFVLSTLLFVFFLFRVVETETWLRSLLKSILVTTGNYLVFVVWMGIHLPKGILPW